MLSSSTPKMEAARFSESSVDVYQTSQRRIATDGNLYSHRHENFMSEIVNFLQLGQDRFHWRDWYWRWWILSSITRELVVGIYEERSSRDLYQDNVQYFQQGLRKMK
jgi:hypothetical protein